MQKTIDGDKFIECFSQIIERQKVKMAMVTFMTNSWSFLKVTKVYLGADCLPFNNNFWVASWSHHHP